MKTICLDPVTPPLLMAGHLSFVTVDRPPPDGWIGQRVAIYAGWMSKPNADLAASLGLSIDMDHVDAIVGSGPLVEALPIYDYDDAPSDVACIAVVRAVRTGLVLRTPELSSTGVLVRVAGGITEWVISDQLPLQDWLPGRWALRFTDVAPTSERCPCCWSPVGDHWSAYCEVTTGAPVVAPVLSGDDPTYKKWRT